MESGIYDVHTGSNAGTKAQDVDHEVTGLGKPGQTLPRQAKCRTLVNYSAKDMSLSASGLVSSPTQDMLRQDCWLASTELLIRHTRNPTRSR